MLGEHVGNNIGYQTARRSPESDECFTPEYAVTPLLEFIPPNSTIWCPFDDTDSSFYQVFKNNGFKVIVSHINEGKDFLSYVPPEDFDFIISNPPFSIKYRILDRCYNLNKPFAMLLPIPTIHADKAVSNFKKYGCELLTFNKRVNFYTRDDFSKPQSGVAFGSGYFCHGVLPDSLIFRDIYPNNSPHFKFKQ